MHVVIIGQHTVGRCSMLLPERPMIKGWEEPTSGLHAFEATDPKEIVRLPFYPVLAKRISMQFYLGSDKMGFEVVNKIIPLTSFNNIIPELDDTDLLFHW